MSDLTYLFIAYTVIWVVVFSYLFFIKRKQRRLRRRIDLLQKSARLRD